MGLGFVVARFGLFLRTLPIKQGGTGQVGTVWSEVIGIVLVAAGALAMGLGLRSFQRARTQIEMGQFVPDAFATNVIASVTLAAGLALIVYLVLSG